MDSKTSILATKEDLVSQIGSTKEVFANFTTSIIKWMFFFWITQLLTTFGLLLLFL